MASNNESPAHSTPPSLAQPSATNIEFSFWKTFKPHIPHFLLTMFFDVALPLVLFFVLQKRLESVYVLLIAGIPPLFMILIKAIRSRTFDALGFLIFISFVISAIVAVITHSGILLLLEKSLVTGVLSVIFAITLIPFGCCKHRCTLRPLAYYFYQDLVPTKRAEVGLPDYIFDNESEPMKEEEGSTLKISDKQEVAQVYQWIYKNCASFRLSCHLLTITWSVGLLLEFLGRLTLILVHLSVQKIVIYGHVILSVITASCIILSILCIIQERKQTLESISRWKEENVNIQLQQLRTSELPVWVVSDDDHTKKIFYEMNEKVF